MEDKYVVALNQLTEEVGGKRFKDDNGKHVVLSYSHIAEKHAEPVTSKTQI